MSYTYLQATGVESWAESFQAMFQSAPWKSTRDAGKLYFNANETAFCHGSPFGMMCELLTVSRGGESPKSSVAGFHALTFRQPELIRGLMEKQTDLMEIAQDCGIKWRESLAKFNLNLSVLKTPHIYELKDLSESSKTLTAWGMTQSGVCLDVAVSAQTIKESECSSLPTPTRHNAKEGGYPAEHTRNTKTLAAQIGGKINPDWNEWRMGCPTRWSDLQPLETDKFRQWLLLHGKL